MPYLNVIPFYALEDGKAAGDLPESLKACWEAFVAELPPAIRHSDSLEVRNARLLLAIDEANEALDEQCDDAVLDVNSAYESRQSGDVWDDTKDGVSCKVVPKVSLANVYVFGCHSSFT